MNKKYKSGINSGNFLFPIEPMSSGFASLSGINCMLLALLPETDATSPGDDGKINK